MELSSLSATELAKKVQSGEVKVKQALEEVFSKIEEREEALNCYITLEKEAAFRQAEALQEKIDTGNFQGTLAGVPVAVKDNICTKEMRTTCTSKMLSSFVPSYDATVVEALKAAGAIVIGKTNMDEFAMGSTTETSAFGVTKNPWNEAHVPGGSSGGSAAAVAAGECFFALGSDTGGSVRQPAGFCGVVGLKPTYGLVSRYGLVSYASSLDQIGPITKNVEDCASVLEVLSVYDEKDSTMSARAVKTDYRSALQDDITGMKIGIPEAFFTEDLQPEVKSAILDVEKVLRGKGAVVEKIDLRYIRYAIPAYYVIATAQASSNLARFDGVKYGFRAEEYAGLHDMYSKTRAEGFGEEVKRRLMLGAFTLSEDYYEAYYKKALQVKQLLKQELDAVFETYDAILSPVADGIAPKIGESLPDPLKMYLGDVYTVCANLAGIPAISVPCGKDKNGLPIGVQFMADSFREKTLLRLAYSYEQSKNGQV